MIKTIDRIVCNFYKLPIGSLQLSTRKRTICLPRQIAMYFSALEKDNMGKKLYSFFYIGNYFAGKDHATAMHAVKTINDLTESDKFFKSDIEEIGRQIKSFKENSLPEVNKLDYVEQIVINLATLMKKKDGQFLELLKRFDEINNRYSSALKELEQYKLFFDKMDEFRRK